MYLDTYERQNDWMVVRRAGLLFGSSPLHGFIVMYSTGIRAWGPYKYLLGFWKFYQLHTEEGLSS